MNLSALRLLTWGTVAGSVASALLLAAGESALPRFADGSGAPGQAAPDGRLRTLPSEPTAAGRPGAAAHPAPRAAPASDPVRVR